MSKKLFTVIFDENDIQEGYDMYDVNEVISENFCGVLTRGGIIDELDKIEVLEIGESYVYHNEHKNTDELIIQRTN